MTDLETAKNIIRLFDKGREALTKHAFTPMAPPAPPATAMPPGGAPPMDPAMMGGPPPGAMPPGPPMDPAMAGGPPPPPMDPNAMHPEAGGPPLPPGPEAGGPPPGASQIPPQLESQLTQMAQGMGGVVEAVESQQANLDQMTDRMLELEQKLDEVSKKEEAEDVRAALKQPAGFEGGEAPAPSPEGAPAVAPKDALPLR